MNGKLIGDTNVLDLDQEVFSKSDTILEEDINKQSELKDETLKDQESSRERKVENIINLIEKKIILNKL